MPKAMEKKLKSEAKKKFKSKAKQDAYVYGTMNKLGYMKGNKTTAKGKAAEKKSVKKPAKKRTTKKAKR